MERSGDKEESHQSEERRSRALTEKGNELYESIKDTHVRQLNHLTSKLDALFQLIATSSGLDSLSTLQELTSLFNCFKESSTSYQDFLKRTNTAESQKDLASFNAVLTEKESQFKQSCTKLQQATDAPSVSRSVKSRSSRSTSSSQAARLKAKAEAAKVRLQFARKELEMAKRKADVEQKNAVINAELQLLSEEKEAAAAEVEAKVFEKEEMGGGSGGSSIHLVLPNQTADQKTGQFVLDHVPLEQAPTCDPQPNPNSYPLSPYANPYPKALDTGTSFPQDLTKFLLKKDLMSSRLTHFSERPEMFEVWRSSFQSIMRELQVSPQEELDLLVKYLGPESSKYALSLRASNPDNPSRGLRLLWERLEERYGTPEIVESCIRKKLNDFPQLTQKDSRKLYDLCDLLDEIQCVKTNPKLAPLFAVYDSSTGVNVIISKLPHALKQKWVNQASTYKKEHGVVFPPFSFVVDFIRNQSKIQNDPAFQFANEQVSRIVDQELRDGPRRPRVTTRKQEINDQKNDAYGENVLKRCPIHKAHHTLAECKAFNAKSLQGKRDFLKENRICFRCLSSTAHMANKCTATVKCEKCGKRHCTPMHEDRNPTIALTSQNGGKTTTVPANQYGGEFQTPVLLQRNNGEETTQASVTAKCTSLCGNSVTSRSCGKIVLVRVSREGKSVNDVQTYAVLDDQSNRSLASPDLLNQLGIAEDEITYTLSTCSGSRTLSGRRATNLIVQSHDRQKAMKLPPLLECEDIPDDRTEIPTPEVAKCHHHLSEIAEGLSHLRSEVPIGLLIGRDLPEAHHVLQQITGPPSAPFAQRLPLGWVIIGDVCLEKAHRPLSTVHVNKTFITDGKRGTLFEPCFNKLEVRDVENIAPNVFQKTHEDERIGTSVEDRKFLELMDQKFRKNEENRWSAPLPLKSCDPCPISNRSQALNRARGLHASLKKNPTKREHMFKFMSKIFESGSAEKAPTVEEGKSCWYLPFFGVYHPRKPDKIRGVFDSSATFEGLSLNNMLMSGPDLTNSLIGILLRFRRDNCAITADIEQMFYQFFVDKPHRDFLRFFWYQDNDFNKPLIEYQMCVHVFGNSPSPAVATYGLRKAVEFSEDDVRDFVSRNFYVDDGIKSLPQRDQAVSLAKRTQTELMNNGKIRLHKFASNDRNFLSAFPKNDLCTELQSVDLSDPSVPLPIHHCLGLPWNLNTDCFEVRLNFNSNSFTRREVLSTLNGIYDPLGFIAPATISGKILLRDISPAGNAWDEPLSVPNQLAWQKWQNSLEPLQGLEIPRMYVSIPLSKATDAEFHVFCDASEKAISAVAYVQVPNTSDSSLGFVMGKAKVAPSSGHTIPRLELCAAVLAVELWQSVMDQMDLSPPSLKVTFYTDSKVVLGYISNETRRFYTYVSNRVERIRRVSQPEQWKYVPTTLNPADLATRDAKDDIRQKVESWLCGPSEFLQTTAPKPTPAKPSPSTFPLVLPDADAEIRPCVKKTEVIPDPTKPLFSTRFEKFSDWNALVRSLCLLKHVCRSFQSASESCKGWHLCSSYRSVENLKTTEIFILQVVQTEFFASEIQHLQKGSQIPKSSTLLSLSPYLDAAGLLRVGGRLSKAEKIMGIPSVHPIILPKNHHISALLVKHYHKKVKHQGRHFTEGALRSEGFWIIGAKQLVSSTIHNCFTCRQLRGRFAHQQMADLPQDKVLPSAPFSHVGVDVFGPWTVSARKTRGGLSHSKRWAVIFTCMAIRAIHLEVLEEMSSSSFINALRRFIALRGPVVEMRSDRGTNFIGAANELNANCIFVETGPVHEHLLKSGISWKFNPPHASHMGGSWERLIGIVRRILDALLLDMRRKPLTHEVLSTLMAEVCAIVNSRPIVSVSHDPDSPLVLTPSMLVTGKCSREQSVFSDSTDIRETYKQQWKHVQVLSNVFWKRWQEDYLQSLQQRRKWENQTPSLQKGDLVLLRDAGLHRNHWPIGLVTRTFSNECDTLVRSVEVRVMRDQKPVTYIRPITELVPL